MAQDRMGCATYAREHRKFSLARSAPSLRLEAGAGWSADQHRARAPRPRLARYDAALRPPSARSGARSGCEAGGTMSEPQGTLKGTPLCRVWPQIEYTRADFRRLADNLLGIPFGSTGPLANPSMDRPLPEIFLGDMDRWTIAMHLRRYADQLK